MTFSETGAGDVVVRPTADSGVTTVLLGERTNIARVDMPRLAPRTHVIIEIAFQLDINSTSHGAGTASVYLNNDSFLQLNVHAVAGRQQMRMGENTLFGKYEVRVPFAGRPQQVPGDVQNFVQTLSPRVGENTVTADVKNYGDPVIRSLTIMKTSRFIIGTTDVPLALQSKGTILNQRETSTGATATIRADVWTNPHAPEVDTTWPNMTWALQLAGNSTHRSPAVPVDVDHIGTEPVSRSLTIEHLPPGAYNATVVVRSDGHYPRTLELGEVVVYPRHSQGDNSRTAELAIGIGGIVLVVAGVVVFRSGRSASDDGA